MKRIGPELPPGFKRQDQEDKPVRRIGPTLPPPDVKLQPLPVELSDDEYGPKPLVGITQEQLEEMELQKKIIEIEQRNVVKKPESESKREDWMLKPPSAKRSAPLNDMKSRTFSRHGVPDTVDQSEWTRQPGEDIVNKRLKVNPPVSKRDQEYKEMVDSYQTNKKSLLEQHVPTPTQTEKRFDRERDIVGSTLDSKKRDKLIQESKNLSSKFAHGSSSFL